jgi:energy-converting hydrogenase Eha subunit H
MVLFRIGFIALIAFLLIFGFLRLCFSRGYLNRERLKRWNRNVSLTFVTIILVVVVMSFIAGVDQNL